QPRTCIALWVNVDDQDLLTNRCQCGCKIDCGRCLTNSTLLICNSNDFGSRIHILRACPSMSSSTTLEISNLQDHTISPFRLIVFYQIKLPEGTALFNFTLVIPAFMKE